jgi:hypothetical protein
MFPDSLIEQIRDRAIEVYESTLGAEIDTRRDPNALCPFHPDSKPSFYVNPDGLWYCQPCGQGGDVFGFLQLAKGLNDFPTAVRHAAQILGIAIPARRPGYDEGMDVRAIRLRAAAKRAKQSIKEWHSQRMKDLVVRAHDLDVTSSRLWQWAVTNRVPYADSIYDKCIQWSSEAKMLDGERRALGEARDFNSQLEAFEGYHGEFTARAFGLSREAWQNVRRYLVSGVRENNRGSGGGERPGPGLFGPTDDTGKAPGHHHPKHLEEGEVEPT